MTSSRRGAALLMVLWLVAALSAIGFSIATRVRGETERAGNNQEDVRATYLAQAGIERALLYMQWGPAFTNPDGSPRYYRIGQPGFEFDFPEGHASVVLIPEASKLSINQTPPEILLSLMAAVGLPEDRARLLTAAIVDWRLPALDGQPSVFDSLYLNRNSSFPSRHASFQEIEELLVLEGMTPELFYGTYEHITAPDGKVHLAPRTGLRDCVSVYGSNGPFDANVVQPEVLLASGVAPEDVQNVVARRAQRPFLNYEEIQATVSPDALGHLRLGGNTVFTLRSTARLKLPDGRLSDLRRTSAALVKFLKQGQQPEVYHVLRWYDRG